MTTERQGPFIRCTCCGYRRRDSEWDGFCPLCRAAYRSDFLAIGFMLAVIVTGFLLWWRPWA